MTEHDEGQGPLHPSGVRFDIDIRKAQSSSAERFRTKRLESDLRPAMTVTAHRAGENTQSGRREVN